MQSQRHPSQPVSPAVIAQTYPPDRSISDMSGCSFGSDVRGPCAPRARVLQPADTIPEPQPIMAINDAVRSEGEWMQIIRGEFLEIPGLRLTADQIQTLWGLHCDVCAAVLEDLLHQRFLQLT